jgi:8-oxo-dGTP diphosphatase
MILTITAPPKLYKEKDIAEIYVVSDNELHGFLQKYSLDKTFSSLPVNVEGSGNLIMSIDRITQTAFQHQANLVIYSANKSMTLYRVQEQKKPGHQYPGVGVGVIIENDQKEVLLTLRSGTTNNRAGLWELPGGTVELGDSLEDTVIKETKEEVGLIVVPEYCFSVVEDFVEGQHWISFGYVTKVVGGRLQNCEPHKFDKIDFFNPLNLPKNTADLTRKELADYLNNNRPVDILNI